MLAQVASSSRVFVCGRFLPGGTMEMWDVSEVELKELIDMQNTSTQTKQFQFSVRYGDQLDRHSACSQLRTEMEAQEKLITEYQSRLDAAKQAHENASIALKELESTLSLQAKKTSEKAPDPVKSFAKELKK